MANTYTTVQGDMWDQIAYRLFGSEKYMQQLIETNWGLLEILVFPAGVVINVPDIEDGVDSDLPFWRTEEADGDQ